MKGNRKFINGNDEAVSPVIATILMVAITVVLGATVYVWVSDFGGEGKQPPQMSVSKLDTGCGGAGYTCATYYATFQVASLSEAVDWGDLAVKLDGDDKNFYKVANCATAPDSQTGTMTAGAHFCITDASDLKGRTMTISHPESGSVLVTVTV